MNTYERMKATRKLKAGQIATNGVDCRPLNRLDKVLDWLMWWQRRRLK